MADPTGFLKYDRKDHPKRPTTERLGDWREVYDDLPTAERGRPGPYPGRAVHGLRHPVLPQRQRGLSAGQPDSGVERLRPA